MRKRSVAAVAALLALVGAACSGGDEGEGPSSSAGAEAPVICPLTGEEPSGGVDATRPAIAVKVENSPESRPQSGLEDADLVIEEIVEGGITRFMTIFQCNDAKHLGPVRSARFDDANIMKPFTRAMAYAGSNDIVDKELAKNDVISILENESSALFRDPPGSTDVHSLFTKTKSIRAEIEKEELASPEEGIFQHGELPDSVKGKKTKRVTINFNASNTIEYKWSPKGWQRFEAGLPFMSATGGQITTPNLLIQEVEVNNSKSIFDTAGNPSPEINLGGSGKAVLFRDGVAIVGEWTTPQPGEAPTFKSKNGEEFVFAPGQIWWELVPSKTGEVKGSFSFK
jgi:Protein of unknown function (DUF3048) N-terminal domain/Protein of unknown function (DUF3048) C-terminal domain